MKMVLIRKQEVIEAPFRTKRKAYTETKSFLKIITDNIKIKTMNIKARIEQNTGSLREKVMWKRSSRIRLWGNYISRNNTEHLELTGFARKFGGRSKLRAMYYHLCWFTVTQGPLTYT